MLGRPYKLDLSFFLRESRYAHVIHVVSRIKGMMTNMNRLNSQLRRLKSDVKMLASQLSSLSKKMDELKKEKQAFDMYPGPTMSK